MQSDSFAPHTLRRKLHDIIFEAETRAGKLFDLGLILAIVASVVVVMLESVDAYEQRFGQLFYIAEWYFTIVFTLEYLLRLYCVPKPLNYAFSFFGLVDLLSVIPTYLSLFLPGAQYLLVIRLLRVLRIFRVLKLMQYLSEGQILARALKASRPKITVFLFTVMTMVVILGALMYLIEGCTALINGVDSTCDSNFTSIPRSIYWAIVTLTTVGYGDIAPQTSIGQALAAVVMVMGYAIIAVPTGIVSVELSNAQKLGVSTEVCMACNAEGHDIDAQYCKFCGEEL